MEITHQNLVVKLMFDVGKELLIFDDAARRSVFDQSDGRDDGALLFLPSYIFKRLQIFLDFIPPSAVSHFKMLSTQPHFLSYLQHTHHLQHSQRE